MQSYCNRYVLSLASFTNLITEDAGGLNPRLPGDRPLDLEHIDAVSAHLDLRVDAALEVEVAPMHPHKVSRPVEGAAVRAAVLSLIGG